MKTAAVIPSTGIGDGLLMMVASHTLRKKGFEVTTFHPKLQELKEWFVGHHFANIFSFERSDEYALVIAQNNNSREIASLIKQRKLGKMKNLSIFYPSYKKGKHAPLDDRDRVFDGKKTMVENIAAHTAALLEENSLTCSKFVQSVVPGGREIGEGEADAQIDPTDNGLIVLPGLTHRLYRNRVVIQPTSTDPKRTWLRMRFVKFARKLKKEGFHPIFTLTLKERKDPIWDGLAIETPSFQTLSELAAYVYESGYVIGNDSMLPHLASNLNIPHLIIGHLEDHMRLWRPGWLKGKLILPSSWIPNVKFLRLRNKHWKQWITVKAVLRAFQELTRST